MSRELKKAIDHLETVIDYGTKNLNNEEASNAEKDIQQAINIIHSEMKAWADRAPEHVDTGGLTNKEFWDEIILSPDGTINIKQVYEELADFRYVMKQVPKVYCHITNDTLSKVMYPAETVIALADDVFDGTLAEAVALAKKELQEDQVKTE